MAMVRKYGLDFGEGALEAAIDLACAKKWREPYFRSGNLLDPWEHLLRAIRALFEPDEFNISPWTEEHAWAWTTSDFTTILGGASCSKSNDIGGFALLDYIVDPDHTVTIMASTSKEMLQVRTYEAVLRYYAILKRRRDIILPFKVSTQPLALLRAADAEGLTDEIITQKCGIRGVAVAQGNDDEARAKLQGAHEWYVRLILDEMAQMRRAAVDVRTNLSIGAQKDFKFVGMANPDSFMDLACEFSEPIDGWPTVDENTPRWKTRFGVTLHHNAFDSPALKEPEKYPYLASKAQIDKILVEERGNMDAPQVWKMLKGFPMKLGDIPTVLSDADLQLFGAMDPAEPSEQHRMSAPTAVIGGLDPAFTSGGDGCVLQLATVMPLKLGNWVLGMHEPIYIPLLASSSRGVIYQIADFVGRHLRSINMPIENLCVDDTGTQSVADVLDVELKGQCLRSQFGGAATEKPVSGVNSKPAEERFANHGTEIWYLAAEFVKHRQLKGLNREAAKQLTMRRTKTVARRKQLESKKDFTKRLHGQKSPDEGDAVALCCRAARDILGWIPGTPWTGKLIGPETPTIVIPGFMPMVARRQSTHSNYVDSAAISGYTAN